MEKTPDIRFMYFTDPKCEHRTVTLARELVGDTMHIAWAVNKVSVEDYTVNRETHTTYGHSVRVFDKFSKPIARKICRGRLRIGRAVELPLDKQSSAPFIQQMIDAIGVKNCKPTLSWVNKTFEEYDEIEEDDGEFTRVPRLAVPTMVARVVRDSRARFLADRGAPQPVPEALAS